MLIIATSAMLATIITLLAMDFQQTHADTDYLCQMQVCRYELTVSNVNYTIPYRLAGAITNISVNTERNSLVIEATTSMNNTQLVILLPTALIQASTDPTGKDASKQINFTAFLDGNIDDAYSIKEDTPYSSEDVPFYRTLIIPYSSANHQVEIVGTQIAPEFNSVSLIIVGVAISSTLVLSSRKLGWYR